MHHFAYLAGVILGDGWCTPKSIGLRVADLDFAEAFAHSLNAAFSRHIAVRKDERGYWLVRSSNATGVFSPLLAFRPSTDEERAAWLRGMFDGEGNVTLRPSLTLSQNSWGRRVAFFSTDTSLLDRVRDELGTLGLPTVRYRVKRTEGHLGDKPVFALHVRGSQSNYSRFAKLVGSNIARKQKVLDTMESSYHPDPSARCREAQLKGAKANHHRTMTKTLPRVLQGVRDLIGRGVKPTQRNCRAIAGYNSVQRWVAQADLVRLALDL